MTIRDKLQELLDIKQDIKEAIENRGVDMAGVDFGGYAGKIDEIQTGECDILYSGTGTGVGSGLVYYTVKDDGRIVLLHLNNLAQDFPSISTSEVEGLFIVNDGTNTTMGQGHTYSQPDGSSMGIISNAYMIIFSNGLIILKFDTSFPEEEQTGGGASGGYTVTIINNHQRTLSNVEIIQTNDSDFTATITSSGIFKNVTYIKYPSPNPQYVSFTGITHSEIINGKTLENDITIETNLGGAN